MVASLHDAAPLDYFLKGGDDVLEDGGDARSLRALLAPWHGLWHAIGTPGIAPPPSLAARCRLVEQLRRGIALPPRVPGTRTDQARDLVLSAPKPVSVAWAAALACGWEALRRAIEEAQAEAVARTLGAIEEEGLFVLRRGHGGARREAAAGLVALSFLHGLSRAGDPQLHTHLVIPCLARRLDGCWRRLEPKRLFEAQRLISALYDSALAAALRRRGLRTVRGEKRCELFGVPSTLCALFAKRSARIAEVAGAAASPARRAAIAQATRAAKKEPEETTALVARWREEAQRAGIPLDAVVAALARSCAPSPTPGDGPWHGVVPDEVVHQACRGWETSPEQRRDHLLAAIAAAVGHHGHDPRRVLAAMLRTRLLIPCGHDRGEPRFTTRAARERDGPQLAGCSREDSLGAEAGDATTLATANEDVRPRDDPAHRIDSDADARHDLLRRYAEALLGGEIARPEDALVLCRGAQEARRLSRALREIWKEAGVVDEREITLRIPRRTPTGRTEHDTLVVSRGDRLRFTRRLVCDGIAIPEGTIATVDAILPGEDGASESADKPVALRLRLPSGTLLTLRPDALAPRRGQGASVRRPALCHAYAATPRDPRRATPTTCSGSTCQNAATGPMIRPQTQRQRHARSRSTPHRTPPTAPATRRRLAARRTPMKAQGSTARSPTTTRRTMQTNPILSPKRNQRKSRRHRG